MATTAHGSLTLVDIKGVVRPLQKIRLGHEVVDSGKREGFLQELVNDHPTVLPMDIIEPAFTPLISICMELSTSAGYLDNLWMTPTGGIVLGECKLLRNPQSRREVVVQALDYARAINEWNYEDLEREVGRARGSPGVRLWDLVDHEDRLDEDEFHDAVERRLRLGRFLCLVIADGIQEGAESLARYLQLHAGLHVGLALVDLSIWELPDGSWVVAPRVPTRTTIVERGVVTVPHEGGIRVSAPAATGGARQRSPDAVRSTTLSEAEFIDAFSAHHPTDGARLEVMIRALNGLGLEIDFGKSLIIRLRMLRGKVNLGVVDVYGRTWFDHGSATANKLGISEMYSEYLSSIASLGHGTVKRSADGTESIVGSDGKSGLAISSLLDRASDWLAHIERLLRSARNVDEQADEVR